MSIYKFLAWSSPGLQSILIKELNSYDIKAYPNKLMIYPSSAVFFNASLEKLNEILYSQNTITYLNLQIAQGIEARTPKEFLKNIQNVLLHPYIPVNAQLDLKLSIKSSIFDREWNKTILDVLLAHQQKRLLIKGDGEEENIQSNNQQLVQINAYLYKNKMTLYVQLHNESLHKHGIKKFVGRVPLAENIAAALINSAQLQDKIIWDLFCGCGSIILSALVKQLKLQVRKDAYLPLYLLPIYKNIQTKIEQGTLQNRFIGSDLDKRQIINFTKNLRRLGINQIESKSPFYSSFEGVNIACQDYRKMYNHLKGQNIMVISNPPWNQEIKFDEFHKMINFFETRIDETYLLITNEQYKKIDQSKWQILAEPLVGGIWTKIIYHKKGQVLVQEIKSDLDYYKSELQYNRDLTEFESPVIKELSKNIEQLSKKINNIDYQLHLKEVTYKEAKKYQTRLTKLRVGKKVKIRQLMLSRQRTLYKTKIRNLNLQIIKLRESMKKQQLELKKVEVKDKVIMDKFRLDKLDEKQQAEIQKKLDQLARAKSQKIIKNETKIAIPKW